MFSISHLLTVHMVSAIGVVSLLNGFPQTQTEIGVVRLFHLELSVSITSGKTIKVVSKKSSRSYKELSEAVNISLEPF